MVIVAMLAKPLFFRELFLLAFNLIFFFFGIFLKNYLNKLIGLIQYQQLKKFYYTGYSGFQPVSDYFSRNLFIY